SVDRRFDLTDALIQRVLLVLRCIRRQSDRSKALANLCEFSLQGVRWLDEPVRDGVRDVEYRRYASCGGSAPAVYAPGGLSYRLELHELGDGHAPVIDHQRQRRELR